MYVTLRILSLGAKTATDVHTLDVRFALGGGAATSIRYQGHPTHSGTHERWDKTGPGCRTLQNKQPLRDNH